MGRLKKDKTLQVRMAYTDKNKLKSIAHKYNYKSVSNFIRNIPKIIGTINAIDVLDDFKNVREYISKYEFTDKDVVIECIDEKITKWSSYIGV